MRRVVRQQTMKVRAAEVKPGDYVKGPGSAWIEVLHARPVPSHHAVELTLNLEIPPPRRKWWQRRRETTVSLFTSHVDSSAVLDIAVLRDIAVDDADD